MAVIISLLRAVNVGGHCQIKMDALRALYESLGLRDARTYVQSGNVIFKTQERNLVQLARRIENALERTFGFRPDVIVRTPSEMRSVIVRNPFAKRTDIEPRRLLVHFLSGDPGEQAQRKLLELETEPEELRLDGRELYIYFPNGMGRPKFSWAAVNKALGTPGTGRNWNSVTKLIEIADELEKMRTISPSRAR